MPDLQTYPIMQAVPVKTLKSLTYQGAEYPEGTPAWVTQMPNRVLHLHLGADRDIVLPKVVEGQDFVRLG